MNQKAHLEWGAIDRVGEYLTRNNAHKVFFVRGKNSYEESGAREKLEYIEREYETTIFSDFTANPQKESVEKALRLYKKFQSDVVIAVGGGSAIDVAKVVIAAGDGSIDELIDGGVQISAQKKPFFIAVPTTAGSGSEATHFAVVYRNKIKHSVAHQSLLPDVAVIDPSLTMNMSKHLTAVTGLDALSQAIESYWAVAATKESQGYVKEALRLILVSFEVAVHTPDRDAREGMAYGAYYAGKAINISKTTAPHAMSYYLASHFNVPHGHAVALILGPMIEYIAQVSTEDVNDARGVEHVRRCISEIIRFLGCLSVEEARRKIESLIVGSGLAIRLSQVGLSKEDIADYIHNVDMQRLSNNPRKLDTQWITQFLKEIF